MGQIASELLTRSLADDAPASGSPFTWITADLGTPLIDLEDPEALRRALEEQS